MDSWPEFISSDLRKLMTEELLKGHELTKQLQFILCHDQSSSDSVDIPVDDLFVKISKTFDNSISMLKRADSEEVSQLGSPCWDTTNRKPEDSGESSKSTSHTVKDRRGCYKRRKTAHSWTTYASDYVDDGHAWRKYGQKVILNCKYPRNYFRCTHKYDQLCQASKQVQRIEETPSKYRTTYYGNHTCKNLLGASHQIILEYPDSTDNNSKLLSFGDNNNNNNNNNIALRQDSHFLGSHSTLSIKEENKDELLNDVDNNKINVVYSDNIGQKSSSDYHLSADDLSNFDDLNGINSSSCTTSADHSFNLGMFTGRFDEVDELLQNAF